MEGSRKRATDGKVDGHSKDKKSRNQHEFNKADMAGAAPTKASDDIFDRLIADEEEKRSNHLDAITRRLNDVCALSSEYVDRITDGRTNIGDEEKKGRNNILVPLLKETETFIAECKTSISVSSHKCKVKSCVLGNTTVLDELQSVGALGIFPCLGDDFNVRAPADRETCDVIGLLSLADGRLLVSDSENHNIKLFNVHHKLVSCVELQSTPFDIAEIDGGQVAVCLPDIKKIQLVSVSSILTRGRIIETAVDCWSVTRCGDNLAAVDWDSPDIVEINMRGRKVRTVWTCPHENLKYIIHNTRGELITTDWGAVTRVTRDGVVLARYQGDNLGIPRGLTVHPDGSIYVCDYMSNNIHHITADCTRSIEVFGDGQITEPRFICYNQHDNSLYVSQYRNDCVKVVRLGY